MTDSFAIDPPAAGLPDAMTAAGGRLTIDLAALRANYARLAARAAPAECAAVVKADAYGLGIARVVPVLRAAGCRSFFVATVTEALALAGLLGGDDILYVLNGVPAGAEAMLAAHGVIPVLNTLREARRWQAFAQYAGRPLPAALQLDSGMSRLGVACDEAQTLAEDPAFRAAVPLRLIMSHLASADASADSANADQYARFAATAARFPGVPRSLANSAGIFLDERFRFDLVRPGIALYGAQPADVDHRDAVSPVVTLEARVLQIRDVPVGTGVGYGLTFVAARPSRLATLGVGYADGWPRRLGGIGAAWFGGRTLAIAGRVSMDSMTIDITDLADGALGEGDWVELIGPHRPIEMVAHEADTISYELLTSLGRRYQVVATGADGVSA